MAVAAEQAGEPGEIVRLLAAAPPAVAKSWAARHGLLDVVAPQAGGQGWPMSGEAVDRLRHVILNQGGHTVEDHLLVAPVASHGLVGDGLNDAEWVKFQDGSLAYFKSVASGNISGAQNFGHTEPSEGALHEVAAWWVAKSLGAPWSNMVPAVVLREINGELGSLAAEVVGGQPSWSAPRPTAEADHRAAVFDALVGNQDRHSGNFLWTPSVDSLGVGLIDHGFSFGVPGDRLNMSVFLNRCGGDPLDVADQQALGRLVADLGDIREILRPDRAAELERRAGAMLQSGEILTERGTGSAGLTYRSWRSTTW